jgi:phage baseplate assembly protein W
MATPSYTYRDFSLDFATHPVTGDLVMKTDIASIIQSIRNLVMTSAGEFLWSPYMGGGVGELLFEPNDNMMRMQLYDRIKTTIDRFEPRVEIVSIDIQRFENGYGIYINLTFYALNYPQVINETIPIKRIR